MAKVTEKRTRNLKNKSGKIDITFLSIVLILLTVGLVMLFSASYAYSLEYYDSSYRFISRQSIFAVVGVVLMLLISRIDYHIWRKFAWVLFAGAILLLVVLLLLPPMVSGMNVKRWFVVGPVNFQPSEVAKFAIILLFSSLIAG
ncbi:MAG: FtsW/RodA/SpoVE family cell cycle protein, partial [Acutalibacteraceae bacterium]|nr:FtsW/RodA/SpoVE family cell cycle protein [Acutalibacteraceae bacterium]